MKISRGIEYSALERLEVAKPMDRLDALTEHARAKRIYDLGALDETAFHGKRGTEHWLHARLCDVAMDVVGIDNSELLPAEGLQTSVNGRIVRADIYDLDPVIDRFNQPDVIIAGELIEHLPDTVEFLRSLRRNTRLAGVPFVFSTPNACCWHNALIGLASRESMHRDHLQVYSYKTLCTLFDRAGIELQSLQPTYARFPEMISASSGLKRFAVQGFQRVINTAEWITPMLSAGWVGVARI